MRLSFFNMINDWNTHKTTIGMRFKEWLSPLSKNTHFTATPPLWVNQNASPVENCLVESTSPAYLCSIYRSYDLPAFAWAFCEVGFFVLFSPHSTNATQRKAHHMWHKVRDTLSNSFVVVIHFLKSLLKSFSACCVSDVFLTMHPEQIPFLSA